MPGNHVTTGLDDSSRSREAAIAALLRKTGFVVVAAIWIVVSGFRLAGWLGTVRIGSGIVALLVDLGTVVAIAGGPIILLTLLRSYLEVPVLKTIVGTVVFIPAAGILFVALYAAALGGLNSFEREPVVVFPVGTSDVRIERNDCGPNCPPTILVIQDREVMPGVRFTRNVAYFYPADEASYRVIDASAVEVSVSPYEEMEMPARRQRIDLRPWVIF